MAKTQIKIGKFDSHDDSADVFQDGRNIGYVERIKSLDHKRWATSTSRYMGQFERVSGYQVTMWDARIDTDFTFDTRAQANAYIRRLVKLFPNLSARPAVAS